MNRMLNIPIFSKDNIKEENELIYKRLKQSRSVLQIGVNNKDFKKYQEICRKYSNKRLINTKNILIESFKGDPLLNEIFGNKTTYIKNNDSLTHNSSSINKSYQKKNKF